MTTPIRPGTTLLALCLLFTIKSPGFPAAPTKADIPYGSHPHQLLDVYVAEHGTAPFPVVLWFGGLWKADKHAPVDHFLPQGCAAAIVAAVRCCGMDRVSRPSSSG